MKGKIGNLGGALELVFLKKILILKNQVEIIKPKLIETEIIYSVDRYHSSIDTMGEKINEL